MTSRSWKRSESEIARLLNAQRNPINGRGCQADVESDWLAVEVKSRASLPGWLKKALAQARAGAGLSQLPVAILHEAGQRHTSDLVVIRLQDFVEWLGGNDPPEPPAGDVG